MNGRINRLIGIGFASFVCMATSHAHHSVAAWFDQSQMVEIVGELVELRWQNPHVLFKIRTTDESGEESLWNVETFTVSGVRRWGITPDILAVGERFRVAGNPAWRDESGMFVRHILLSSGEELIFGGNTTARWADRTVLAADLLPDREGASADDSRGIFRVWGTAVYTPFLLPELHNPALAHTNYPLTASARAVLEAFDVIADDPTNDCMPKGMPAIMEQPYPMQFVDRGDVIELHIEEYDLRRLIYMTAVDEPVQATHLGHSVGRWKDGDLVVTTTHVNWGYFDTVGIPASDQIEMVERFSLSADGSQLDYSMTVTDPITFTEPVTIGKHWIWSPGVTVEPFECVSD
jgi:hypothetical protein